jgi:hypothetical protein
MIFVYETKLAHIDVFRFLLTFEKHASDLCLLFSLACNIIYEIRCFERIFFSYSTPVLVTYNDSKRAKMARSLNIQH